MEKHEDFEIKLTLPADSTTADEIEDVFEPLKEMNLGILRQTPIVTYTKDGLSTIATALISATVAALPIIANMIYDWVKTNAFQEIEIEVSRGQRKVAIRVKKGQEQNAIALAKELQKLL